MSDDNDVLAMADTAWGEARSLGETGMQAVINVIMNRVKKQSWYGLTPIEVCFKHSGGVYQFDCNDPKDPNYQKINDLDDNDPQYVIALRLATEAMAGNLKDITNGALNYYSTTIPLPSWAKNLTPSFVVENTNFYNNVA